MTTEAERILTDKVLQETTPFENGMGTVGKMDNQELLFDFVDITTELPSLDATIVREAFTGDKLAGDDLKWTWNRWGQLQCTIGKYAVKGATLKAMYKEMLDGYKYFDPSEEISIDEKWSVLQGTLLLGKFPEVKVVLRGETIIGIFKMSTKVMRTIKWYEKAVYGGKARSFNRAHKVTDYRAETKHDVYDKMHPEFTKEAELEEIAAFLTSLRHRVLSNEEKQILEDIDSELGLLGQRGWIALDSFTDEEIENEYYSRQQD